MNNEVIHIIDRVDRLGERRETYRRDLAARHRLTPPLLLVLRLLESQPGLTMVEFARLLGVSVPTMQGRMNRLDELGLIQRTRSDLDRRKVPTELTAQVKSVLRKVPMAGAGRLLDALERGEVTPRRLRRLAVELESVERLLFPEEQEPAGTGRQSSIWRR
jgi:DNA-binding MarR family transcriptional regulator